MVAATAVVAATMVVATAGEEAMVEEEATAAGTRWASSALDCTKSSGTWATFPCSRRTFITCVVSGERVAP